MIRSDRVGGVAVARDLSVASPTRANIGGGYRCWAQAPGDSRHALRSDGHRRKSSYQRPDESKVVSFAAEPSCPATPLVPTGSHVRVHGYRGEHDALGRERAAMQDAVRRHDAIMRAAIAAHEGHVCKTIGDAFCAASGGIGKRQTKKPVGLPKGSISVLLRMRNWPGQCTVATWSLSAAGASTGNFLCRPCATSS